MYFLLSHSFVTITICFGSLSCWNTHPWPSWGKEAFTKDFPVLDPSIFPLTWCSLPVSLAEKKPQSIMFPTPCLMVGMVFLGSSFFILFFFFFLSPKHGKLMPKSSILVLSDHSTFYQPTWIIQVLICKLLKGLYMCLLE